MKRGHSRLLYERQQNNDNTIMRRIIKEERPFNHGILSIDSLKNGANYVKSDTKRVLREWALQQGIKDDNDWVNKIEKGVEVKGVNGWKPKGRWERTVLTENKGEQVALLIKSNLDSKLQVKQGRGQESGMLGCWMGNQCGKRSNWRWQLEDRVTNPHHPGHTGIFSSIIFWLEYFFHMQ